MVPGNTAVLTISGGISPDNDERPMSSVSLSELPEIVKQRIKPFGVMQLTGK